ncbi:MAG TPA: ComEC/Rec2 family competence protein, partial [bacterium]|nr:ComEC/Rec2 family competence protein [bacterium]
MPLCRPVRNSLATTLDTINTYTLHWPLLGLFFLQTLLCLHLKTDHFVWPLMYSLSLLYLLCCYARARKYLSLLLVLVLPLVSITCHQLTRKPVAENLYNKKQTYVATIVKGDQYTNDQSSFVIDLEHQLTPKTNNISGRIMLTIGEACPLTNKSRVLFTAKIKKPTVYLNPGAFNYQQYLSQKNIWGKAFMQHCGDIIPVFLNPHSLRDKLRTRIRAPFQAISLANANLFSPLTIGTPTISWENKRIIQQAGVSHLFVISGSHFGAMCAIIYCLLTLIANRFPALFNICPRQKIAALGTGLFVIFYLWISIPSPSIMRAGLTALLYFAAILLDRQKNLLYLLLLAATANLLIAPHDLFEISFQLSYLCVLILIVIYPRLLTLLRLTDWIRKRSGGIKLFVHTGLVSLLINLTLMPLIIYFFGTAPTQGFINNLWAIPYFDFVVIPLTLLAMLLQMILPHWTPVFLRLWDHCLTLFFKILAVVDSWQLPVINAPEPHAITIICFYCFVFGIFVAGKKRGPVIPLVLCVFSLWFTFESKQMTSDLKITQIDVGQGDAVLVQTRKKNILIDTGGHRFMDIGTRVLVPYFRHLWLKRLDIVVITHADLDHFGGLSTLIDNVAIGEIWITRNTAQDKSFAQIFDKMFLKNIPLKIVSQGDASLIDQNTSLAVLAPPAVHRTPKRNKNELSLVLRLK